MATNRGIYDRDIINEESNEFIHSIYIQQTETFGAIEGVTQMILIQIPIDTMQ